MQPLTKIKLNCKNCDLGAESSVSPESSSPPVISESVGFDGSVSVSIPRDETASSPNIMGSQPSSSGSPTIDITQLLGRDVYIYI